MSYLPWTDPLYSVSFFGLPTLLYWGASLILFILGLVLYMTSTDFSVKDILNFLPRTLVTVRKRLDKKKILGTLLVLLGFLTLTGYSERLIAESRAGSGGGPSIQTCSNYPNIACFAVGGTGIPAPNHPPPLFFWGTPPDTVSLSNVQGTGQLYNQDFVPTRSRPTTVAANLPCIGTPPTSCNQFYCTGMTSGPFVQVSGNDWIGVSTEFAYRNINDTTPYPLQFVLNLNTAVPATTFQSGHCAAVQTEIGNYVVYSQDNSRTAFGQMTVFTKQPAGTYYASLDAEVINQASLQATFPLAGNGPNLVMWDASLIKAPLGGSPSASSSGIASGGPPDSATAVELPATQAYRNVGKLQSQTTTARLIITIVVPAGAGGGLSGDAACGTCTPVWIQYSADGVTWHDLCGDGTENPRIDIQQAASSTPYKSAFCTMQTGAFADNLFRAVWDNGLGPATQLNLIELELAP